MCGCGGKNLEAKTSVQIAAEAEARKVAQEQAARDARASAIAASLNASGN